MAMIVLPFDPVAVRLGPLVLTWHGIFSALGVLVGMWLAAQLARAAGVSPEATWGAAWWVMGLGAVGPRLLFAAEHLQLFVGEPWRLLLLNEGGISVYGAVLGGMAGGAVAARRAGRNPARLLDAIAPGLLLRQAVGRVGDVSAFTGMGTPVSSAARWKRRRPARLPESGGGNGVRRS